MHLQKSTGTDAIIRLTNRYVAAPVNASISPGPPGHTGHPLFKGPTRPPSPAGRYRSADYLPLDARAAPGAASPLSLLQFARVLIEPRSSEWIWQTRRAGPVSPFGRKRSGIHQRGINPQLYDKPLSCSQRYKRPSWWANPLVRGLHPHQQSLPNGKQSASTG